MRILDFLLDSDPAVKRQTQIHLLEEQPPFTTDGWIGEFLSRYSEDTHTWGNGIYSPKWISTFYTMRDLQSLEIDPQHSIYRQGLETLLEHMWNPEQQVEDDVCVVAMFVSLLTYGRHPSPVINEMVQYLLTMQMPDGGWNCSAVHGPSKRSSIHTTLSVLEAYADYEKEGYRNLLPAIKGQIESGQAYLLRRNLMRRESTGEIIVPYIVEFHFPPRWKYDVLRALVYFAAINYPYVPALEEGLNLLKKKFEKGYLSRGPTLTGRLHFHMETTRIGTMNTLRGLMVLKHYAPDYYNEIISKDIAVSNR
ncbi:prenyltransferase/squalene oxidase repeat-containing protein [Planococcus salinarum]|uniref:hypothetical protein n=1 Tax=Planococcus salinarum TaxID=622695 RepID=UPI000E3E1561|nr:hypothetical protein [Planococcus salinarum]TAA73075.1 hypothetical protein D2909_03295 [Planococcus salinarum]